MRTQGPPSFTRKIKSPVFHTARPGIPQIEVVQEPVTVKFKLDFNLHAIDLKVKAKLRNEIISLPTMRDKLEMIKSERSTAYTIVAVTDASQKIKVIEKEIELIESGQKAFQYLEKSRPILDKYDKIPKTIKMIDIARDVCEDDDSLNENDEMRVEVILEFCAMAGEYIKLDVIREMSKVKLGRCKTCGYDLRNIEVSIDGRQICICGAERYKTKIDKVIEDGSKPGSTTKDYSDEQNFKKAFHRFIGVQKINFDVNLVCAALDTYFRSVGYKSAEYYRAQEPNARGKKDGTSLQTLLGGLKAIKCPKLYEDANFIGSHLWGWKLHDLLHMEETIMSDYRETQKVYDSMTLEERGRKSSLSTQFRLYGHLRVRGVYVILEDFKIPNQRESLCKQDFIWKRMCAGANNSNIYYISTL
jgi:hypothetical protein